MLMSARVSDKCLASLWLMYTLDQTNSFKGFECAIYSNEPQSRVDLTCHIVDFDGGEGAVAGRHGFSHRAARTCEAIALFIELGQPGMFSHKQFLILKTIFIFNYTELPIFVKKVRLAKSPKGGSLTVP